MPGTTTNTNPQAQAAAKVDEITSSTTFDPAGEIEELKKLVNSVPMPAGLKDKVDRMLMRLQRMVQLGSYTKEYEPVEQYIKWVVQIPWGKYTQDNLDLTNAQEKLTKEHYGLELVKERILEYLAVMRLQLYGMPVNTTAMPAGSPAPQPQSPNQPAVPQAAAPAPTQTAAQQSPQEMSRLQGSSSHAPVLCFVGIQGVGKTSIAKSIGNALGRPFVRIALGALGDVSQIRGIPKGEMNAEPGQIVKALIRAGTMNPLILLDEIDKTSSETGLRADLMAALLEILDPEQNSTFVDHYLDYPIDLSKVLFITTANNLGGISAALKDRLEIIRFGSYTDEDKVQIARNYMLPKVREATGITEQQLSFDDDVWPLVVRPLGFDAGVRELERTLTLLCRKVAKLIVEGKGTSFRVTKDNFRQFIPEDIGVYS
jgi:ATP-dependent Lon protease